MFTALNVDVTPQSKQHLNRDHIWKWTIYGNDRHAEVKKVIVGLHFRKKLFDKYLWCPYYMPGV
jgi:hypothetical protein